MVFYLESFLHTGEKKWCESVDCKDALTPAYGRGVALAVANKNVEASLCSNYSSSVGARLRASRAGTNVAKASESSGTHSHDSTVK